MKKIDEEGLKLCALQADIFAESLETTQCSSPIFIRRFMNSQVAARMDHRGFLLEASDAVSILNEVEAQYGPTSYGKERYGREELYWLGYLYRYWAYTYEKSSKQVYKQMKAKELRKLYYPYHSLDPAQVSESSGKFWNGRKKQRNGNKFHRLLLSFLSSLSQPIKTKPIN